MPTTVSSSSISLKRHIARNVFNRVPTENKALLTKEVNKTGVTFLPSFYNKVQAVEPSVKSLK